MLKILSQTDNGFEKTGKLKRFSCFFNKKKVQIIYFFIGLFSFIWILIRIIPKPSRATYPCVQAAYPFAASFLVYLAGLLTSAYVYTRALANFRKKQFIPFFGLLIISIITSTFISVGPGDNYAATFKTALIEPNNPMGEAKGAIPGRVVWFHHPGATDENWNRNQPNNFFSNNHTNIDTVEAMVNASVLKLTETSSIEQAWDSLFIYFNKQHGKGAISYQDDEHIFIKGNFVTAFDQQDDGGPTWTTPQVIQVILRHLINNMSIPQENIALGDPMVCVINDYWNLLHSEFPDVKYIDHLGGNGRTIAEKGNQSDIFYSDKGEILRDSNNSWSYPPDSGDPVYSDTLYKIIEDADYMINIAALKGHHRAGVSLCAKNHFGSHVRTTAAHQHMGLPHPTGSGEYPDELTRAGYGQYRIQVDLMGHNMLGGNTLLFIVDGLWAGPDAGARPEKFDMPPFNNDWVSSVFMSQDQVALESVCLDFLQAEYTDGNPQMDGVDDYLRQAADTTQWPEDFVYDPENDGTPLTSLGVHEHWNNSNDKQYSKELGLNNGIDFIKLTRNHITSVHDYSDNSIYETTFVLRQNYPNPFNPSTTIAYTLKKTSDVKLTIYNLLGQSVKTLVNARKITGSYSINWDGTNMNGEKVTSGFYYYKLEATGYSKTRKMLLMQ